MQITIPIILFYLVEHGNCFNSFPLRLLYNVKNIILSFEIIIFSIHSIIDLNCKILQEIESTKMWVIYFKWSCLEIVFGIKNAHSLLLIKKAKHVLWLTSF